MTTICCVLGYQFVAILLQGSNKLFLFKDLISPEIYEQLTARYGLEELDSASSDRLNQKDLS